MGMGKRLGGGGRLGMLKRFALGMGGKSGVPLVWLLYDEFTTPDAAPITSPRTCEPGPGTLTIVDSGNNVDLVGGELIITGVVGAGDPGFHGDLSSDVTARLAGLAAVANFRYVTTNRVKIGLDDVFHPAPVEATNYLRGTDFRIVDTDEVTVASNVMSSNVYAKSVVINRSAGSFFIIAGTLYWVGNTNTKILDTIIVSITNSASDTRFNTFGALSLPANGYTAWDADFTTVTDTKTNPATGTTFNSDADFHGNYTFTFQDDEDVSIYFRYVDALHFGCWIRLRAALNRIEVEEADGSYSSLAEANGLFTDNVSYTIDVVGEGTSLKLYVNGVEVADVTSQYQLATTNGYIIHQLSSNDIVLSTHPYPALGIATDRAIAPQAADSGSSTKDCLSYVRSIKLPSGGTRSLYRVRIVDATNYHEFQTLSTGGLVLRKVVAGTPTNIITAAGGTVSDDDDIAVVLDGVNAEVFVNGTSAGTSASAVNAGDNGWLIPTLVGGTGADSIELFPYDVRGLLPGALV